jgi:perosamine synthetase
MAEVGAGASALARIPLSEPSLGEPELANLRQCIEENWVSSKGRFVREFEALFATIHGAPDAVSTNTGTAALHLALLALGVGPGDEVLVPALTFAASANVIRYVGATPVFVDVDPDTYTMDPAAAQAALTECTRALMVVHLYGHPADMGGIGRLAREHGLAVVEDATEALGSRRHGELCGTLGDLGCFSFNGNKVITTGGGGMVLARHPKLLDRVRHLSLQARVPGTREYLHDDVGFNYTLSNLQAAVGLPQLERLDELVNRRRMLAARYAAGLRAVPGLRFCAEADGCESNRWLMSVLVDEAAHGRSPARLMDDLAAQAIEARPFFMPLPDLPPYAGSRHGPWPVSKRLHACGVSIPSSAGLDDDSQDRVIAALSTRS